MSASDERPNDDDTPPTTQGPPEAPDGGTDTPEAKPEARPDKRDPTEELKKGLATPRLPADLREQILAELPPLEEQERLLRELLEHGGLSFEEFMESLGLEVESQP